MEEWRSCRQSRTYEVSNEGRIRNRRTGRILKTHIDGHGYEALQLHYDGGPHSHKVHRLVTDAFYDGDHTGLDADHRDGNKLNNHVSNLELCSRQENVRRAFEMGLNRSHRKQKVRIVETGEIFESIRECADHLGVDPASVRSHLYGRSRSCGGRTVERI